MAKRRAKETAEIIGKIHPDLLPLAVPIDSLIPDPENANQHDDQSIEAIRVSYATYGQLKPIVVVRSTNVVKAGNGQLEAAKRLGWSHIAVIKVDHDPATATGFAIADNRTAQFATWNLDALLLANESIKEHDPALATALQLDALLPAVSAAGDEPVEIPQKYSVLIECTSEAQQREVFERLQAGKFPPAKVLTI